MPEVQMSELARQYRDERDATERTLAKVRAERDSLRAELGAARACIAELEAENGRLRAMRHHDLHAWKHDPDGPVTQ